MKGELQRTESGLVTKRNLKKNYLGTVCDSIVVLNYLYLSPAPLPSRHRGQFRTLLVVSVYRNTLLSLCTL